MRVAFPTGFEQIGFAMPHLDAAALTQDPDGLAFLSDVLGAEEVNAATSRLSRPSLDRRFAVPHPALPADAIADVRDLAFA